MSLVEILMTNLPIQSKKQEILDAVKWHQTTIVVSETGAGKTTQIPAFLYEAGYARDGKKIGVTQPRRIAATSVAAYVAKQLGTDLGEVVGYQVRFNNNSADNTRLKFMTDGILLQEIQSDPDLSAYSVIVVDEAHERSENIDFLLGLLKNLLKRRRDLKVVVTSATIDEKRFSEYFGNAPIINVSGRMYPVSVVWSSCDYHEDLMVDAVVDTVVNIHKTMPDGDVLVFMTGRDDIMKVVERLEEVKFSRMLVLPVYGDLSFEDQQRIFQSYPGRRKIVVATNIAETSITVDGVVYVVDSGLIKQSNFHSETGIKSLDTVEHSQAGCQQRMGRAGRVQSGICYRMYTKDNYEARPKFTKPEILRVSLADVVLKMENIGIANVEGFDFIEAPDRKAFHEAYETLIALGAIRRGVKGLTEIGEAMADLPLDARIARMVLEAKKYNCVKDVATVAAFLSVRNVFFRPKEQEKQFAADLAHQRFHDHSSDAVTFLYVWEEYVANGMRDIWCFQNFLNAKSLREAGKIREQLLQILASKGFPLDEAEDKQAVAKAVAMGLAYNLYEHNYRGAYADVRDFEKDKMYIHPSSCVFRNIDRFVVAAEILKTTRVFGRVCTIVRPEWLPELAPDLCSKSTTVSSWVTGQTEATVLDKVSYKGSVVSESERQVPVDEAARIQDAAIKQAEKDGLVRLWFREVRKPDIYSHHGYSVEYVAEKGFNQYKTWSYTNVDTAYEHMCKVESFLGESRATPVFPIFRFAPGVRPTTPNPTVLGGQGVRSEVLRTLMARELSPKEAANPQSLKPGAPSTIDVATASSKDPKGFTDMGGRWFKCSCGTTTKVDKNDWRKYTEGGVISVKCDSCHNIANVGKQTTLK